MYQTYGLLIKKKYAFYLDMYGHMHICEAIIYEQLVMHKLKKKKKTIPNRPLVYKFV
jgi:hypothetical protein